MDALSTMVAAAPVVREVKLGDAKFTGVKKAELTGVDTDYDAEPTVGVEVDTGAYGEAYDSVPQKQGRNVEVNGLGQQNPTGAQSYKGKKHKVALTWMTHKVAMTRIMTLLSKLMMLVTLNGTTMAHKSMKALLTVQTLS